jgi:superoxide dismutase, Cu-Zn family
VRAFDRVIQIAVVILGVVVVAIVVIASIVPTRATTAQLNDAQGNFVGTALFTQSPDGVRIYLASQGLEPGEHGIHFHERGECIPPDFMSAGAHFNPTSRSHGLANLQGPHAGDLPNLSVSEAGTGVYETVTDRVTLSDGPASLLQPGGTALVIHALPDDQMTDPAGNSGTRIACGVISR